MISEEAAITKMKRKMNPGRLCHFCVYCNSGSSSSRAIVCCSSNNDNGSSGSSGMAGDVGILIYFSLACPFQSISNTELGYLAICLIL